VSKEADEKAKEYASSTVFVSKLGEEADADALIHNLRFMAYGAGYQDGQQAAARELEELRALRDKVRQSPIVGLREIRHVDGVWMEFEAMPESGARVLLDAGLPEDERIRLVYAVPVEVVESDKTYKEAK
jgi:hypothetical protein